jgi:HNH endonuclease
MAAHDNIPIPYLRECLSYDAETGVLRWRERPRAHFPDDRWHQAWNTRNAGTEAGQIKDTGYRQIEINYYGKRRIITAHRTAWALQTGEYPRGEIAHDDLDRDNNRFRNLKPMTSSARVESTWRTRL